MHQYSPGTPASSTTKTGRHDIAEILMKVTLNTKNSNHSIRKAWSWTCVCAVFDDDSTLYTLYAISKFPRKREGV